MSDTNVLDMDITTDPSQSNGNTSEVDVTSDDESKITPEDTTVPEKTEKKTSSNKSNFKKLAKANKEKDRRIAELEAKLSNNNDDDEGIESEDDDIDEPIYDKVDLLEFITDTEGASSYKDAIKETLEEFPGISFEKAFQFAKAQNSESESYTSFNAKSRTVPKKKKLNELTKEEAINADLSPEQFDAWSNNIKKSVNPFG